MINPLIILVGGVFSLIFGGFNYYIGLRGWQSIFSFVPFLSPKAYWLAFWILSMSYIIARLGQKYLPKPLHEGLSVGGAVWMALMVYLFIFIVAIDLLRLLDRWLKFIPVGIKQNANPVLGIVVLILVLVIVSYGAWNARHPRVNHYDISIAKQAGSLKQLHVVMVSDIHLGTIIHNGYLTTMVDSINQLKPDLILFAGDILDENIEAYNKQELTDNFKRLNAPYGVYASLGNHEYMGGNAEDVIKYLNDAGVKVIKDSYQEIAGCFYLVGRDDLSSARFNGVKRQELKTLMQGIDQSQPIILMDHQPSQIEEAQEQGVDLQLSGHTHSGQMFPFQLVTQRIFEKDWGFLRKNNFQLIVSSGYGTWGPPIRVGNFPEIVDITLRFTE